MRKRESYPPVIRRVISEASAEAEEEEGEVNVNREKDMAIPVMDMERLEAESVGEACREWGIFRVENHGIPRRVTSGVMEMSKQLLNLPFETKGTLMAPPLSYFWGTPALTPSGTALRRASAAAADVINFVEGFNLPLSSLSHLSPLQHPLLQPFRGMMEEYGRHVSRVAVRLFEAISESLQVEMGDEFLSEKTGLLRLYRYPPISGGGAMGMGMEVHTDSSVLSILNQDQVGGLQFFKDAQWFNVQPLPNTLIVNLGDMMQAMSNDEYKSVKHRVVGMNKGRERLSICYFVFPEEDTVINSSRYKPFTYSQFQAQVQLDLHTLGSKVGLPRFSLS